MRIYIDGIPSYKEPMSRKGYLFGSYSMSNLYNVVWPVPVVGELLFPIDFLKLIEIKDEKIKTMIENGVRSKPTKMSKAWYYVVVSQSIVPGETEWKSGEPFPFLCEGKGVKGFGGVGTDSVEVFRGLALAGYGMAVWNAMVESNTSSAIFSRELKYTFSSKEMVVALSKSARAMVLAKHTIEHGTNIRLESYDYRMMPFMLLENGFKIYSILFDILMYNIKPKPPGKVCSKEELIKLISIVHAILSATKDGHYPVQFSRWYSNVKRFFLSELIYLYGVYLYQETDEPFEVYDYKRWGNDYGDCRKHAIMYSWSLSCLKSLTSAKQGEVKAKIDEIQTKVTQDYFVDIPPQFNNRQLLDKIKSGSEWAHQPGYTSMFETNKLSDPELAREKLITEEALEPIQF